MRLLLAAAYGALAALAVLADDAPPSDNSGEGDVSSPPDAAASDHHLAPDPLVSVEMRVDDLGGADVWTPVAAAGDAQEVAGDEEASPIEEVEEEEEQIAFAELEALLDDTQGLADPRVLEKLQELLEAVEAEGVDGAASDTDRLIESLADDVADQILDALSGDLSMTPAAAADAAEAPPELTDAFLELERLLEADGFTREVVAQLEALARDRGDVYAKETLAYMELFEPEVAGVRAAPPNVAEAFANLRSAADAAVMPAMSTLALLNLIDFGVPRNVSVTTQERHDAAATLLERLAKSDDLTASLAVGYKYLRAMLKQRDQTAIAARVACSNAILHFHRCAESNIHALAELGGEKAEQIVERLSEEWLPVSAFARDDDLAAADPAQRFEYYRTLAGDPTDPQFAEAAEQVGQAYFYGDEAAGVTRDQAMAADYFQRAADAGDPHAQANYAMMLANGAGIAQNNASALQYFRAAAAQRNAFAHFGLGLMYQSGSGAVVPKNETLALLYFETAAQLGYQEAHSYIGSAYLHGRGVAANGSKAFEHFSLAAESKSSQALFNLAVVQYRGIGTPRSCELAVHNFRVVALHPEALADLPFSLAKGYECYQKGDYLRAFLHYRLVAEFGDEDAQINAAYLLEKHGDAIFPTLAGDAANLWMGTTKRPLAEAFELYTQAASLNDTEGIRKTAMCFYDDWGGVCERNRTTALERYSLAADLGDSEAAYNCGLMHALGDGVRRDLETAKVSGGIAATWLDGSVCGI